MKALLLGDASNYHFSLACALRARGHDVTVASDGSRWMETRRDIDLTRRPGKLGGALLWLRLNTLLARDLRGYDVVQLVAPTFLPLRPCRLLPLFRRLKRDNGAVYLTALGTDSSLVGNLLGPSPALRYSEYNTPAGPSPWSASADARCDQWLERGLREYTDEIYNGVDGAVTALYEYHRIVSAEYPDLPLAYGGIPVEIPAGPPRRRSFEGKIRVMLPAHRGREAEKGADVLLDLFRRLDAGLPGRMDLWRPGNVPYAEFCRLLDQADIVVDQLYSYTPATTALLAMARGAVAVTGSEDEFYRFIGEGERRPVFNPDPCDPEGTYSRLRELLGSPEALRRMSEDAPGFVRSHNSGDVVAARFERFWTR